MVDLSNLRLEYPMFEDQLEPKGLLVRDKRSHACFYYMMLALKNRAQVGRGPEDQIIEVDPGLETPLWMDKNYEQIARGVAILYGLSDPGEFLNDHWRKIAWAEFQRLGAGPQELEAATEVLAVKPGGITRH